MNVSNHLLCLWLGAYLIACGPRGALLFMSWLGIRVLPYEETTIIDPNDRPVGSLVKGGSNVQVWLSLLVFFCVSY